MSVVGIQFVFYKSRIVILNISFACLFQEAIAVFHFFYKRIESRHHLFGLGYDGLFLARQLSQIMVLNAAVDAKFHHFGVDKHKLEFGRVLLVEHRGDNGIQAYRFTLTGSTCHKQVGHLSHIGHHHFVRYIATQCHRQCCLRFLECFRLENRAHRHYLRLFVWHFYAHRTLAGHRGYDAYALGGKAEGDIVLKSLDALYAHTFLRHYLKEGDCRAHGHLYPIDFYLIVEQCACYQVLIGFLLLHIDGYLRRPVVFHQVDGGLLELRQFLGGVIQLLIEHFCLFYFTAFLYHHLFRLRIFGGQLSIDIYSDCLYRFFGGRLFIF